jgi:hypothetical protein
MSCFPEFLNTLMANQKKKIVLEVEVEKQAIRVKKGFEGVECRKKNH